MVEEQRAQPAQRELQDQVEPLRDQQAQPEQRDQREQPALLALLVQQVQLVQQEALVMQNLYAPFNRQITPSHREQPLQSTRKFLTIFHRML